MGYWDSIEAPESFVSRLAASNCATSIDNLFRQLGSTFSRSNMLKAERYEIVLDMAGIQAERYDPFYFRTAQRYQIIRDQKLSPRSVCRSRPRYCPVCVCNDVANGTGLVEVRTYQRFYWFLREIGHCPWHRCKMVESEYSSYRQEPADFAPFVKANMARIECEAANSVSGGDPLVEQYLLDRLLDRPTSMEFLDTLQPYVVIRFCELVGRLPLDAKTAASLQTEDLRRAWGFQLLSAGKQKFLDFLTARLGVLAERKKYHGGRGDRYGDLYNRLYERLDNSDWKPIFEMIIEDALEHIPLAQGEIFLDHTVERRRLHSAYSISEQSGLHPATVVKMLRQYGIIDRKVVKSQYHSVTFDAVQADEMLHDIENSIILTTVCTNLGVTKMMVNAFSEAGIIRESAVNKAYTHQKHYRLDDYRKLLSSIEALPVVDAPGDQYRPLVSARKWAEMSASEMYLKILNGDFRSVRVRDQRGLASVHVFRLDVVGERPSERVPAYEVCRILRTSKITLDALMTHGFLTGEIGMSFRGPWSGRWFDRTELERFSEKYISIQNACRERSLHPRIVWLALSKAGIEPVFPVTEKLMPRFYLRADIDGFFENVEITSLIGKNTLRKRARTPIPL